MRAETSLISHRVCVCEKFPFPYFPVVHINIEDFNNLDTLKITMMIKTAVKLVVRTLHRVWGRNEQKSEKQSFNTLSRCTSLYETDIL
jgi:hypothetical protein